MIEYVQADLNMWERNIGSCGTVKYNGGSTPVCNAIPKGFVFSPKNEAVVRLSGESVNHITLEPPP